ncbi:MAG: hypothetical protein GWP14_05355 [Actinobacteria bacterium]|nr:hypothetical protein [Actinomycetota bacterium]
MVADLTQHHDGPSEPARTAQTPACNSQESSCCGCRQISKQLSGPRGPSEPAPIGQVLLVFFLPLACAAAVVIWAVRSSAFLAGQPWLLVLTALGVACGAIALAKVLTKKSYRQAKDEQREK